MRKLVFAMAAWLGCGGLATADEVVLVDGSRIVGQVTSQTESMLVVASPVLGELRIDRDKVQSLVITLPAPGTPGTPGSAPIGGTGNSPAAGSDLVPGAADTAAGGVADADQGGADEKSRSDGEAGEAAIPASQPTEVDPWSYRLEFGMSGQSGSRDTANVRGRFEAERKTETQKLLFYVQGRLAEDRGNTIASEMLGGSLLEVDITRRVFWYAKSEVENDEVEKLDLRARGVGGAGYYLVREAEQAFRVHGGLGYQHEAYFDGQVNDDLLLEAGEDYTLKLTSWVDFKHALTYYPLLTDLSDYRLEMDNSLVAPLGGAKQWKLKIGVRNDYNSSPQRGVDKLETYYIGNLVFDF
ncbi:MAG: DUF481 domain-containing protein [Phycisphaeraceae bacterium]|nr:DUF481 domain-containing protein [Phycisphaeraceae bacterium]